MRLCSYGDGNDVRLGRIGENDSLTDLTGPLGVKDMAALLAAPDGVTRARSAEGPARPLDGVTLLAPVPQPGKVLGIGQNYMAHILEMGRTPPEHQLWFNKQRTCITGPGAPIRLPAVSDMTDYEGELVIVIGRRCRNVPAARAHEVIAGYMIGNDVSVRDWQKRAPTMTLGKSFDTHGPTGPWIVTPDALPEPQDLRLRTWVSGDLRQDARTSDMIFPITEQIALLTTVFTLEPGDLLFTGTPEGVGMGHDPHKFLRDGDTVRIEIEGIGVLENPVVTDTPRTIIE